MVSWFTISNPLPAVAQEFGLAQLVLEAPAGIDDLAAHVSVVELQPQPNRALPMHDGIGDQLADHQAEIVESALIEQPAETPPNLASRKSCSG